MSLGFVWIGWLMWNKPRGSMDTATSILCMLFFGLLSLVFIKRFFSHRPMLVLDEKGILASPYPLIEWQNITAIRIKLAARGQSVICLKLRNEKTFLNQLSSWRRWSMSLNQKMGFDTISLSANTSDYSTEELAELLQDYRQHFYCQRQPENQEPTK